MIGGLGWAMKYLMLKEQDKIDVPMYFHHSRLKALMASLTFALCLRLRVAVASLRLVDGFGSRGKN